MSEDQKLFQAPKPPEPPMGMYEVPKKPVDERPKPIFPWETRARKPTRVFAEDIPAPSTVPSSDSEHSITAGTSSDTEDTEIETVTPTNPSLNLTSAEKFADYARTNAWDDVPEIDRYVASLPQNRRGKVQVLFNKTTNTATPLDSSSTISTAADPALFSPSTEDAPSTTTTSTTSQQQQQQQRRPSMKLTDFPSEIERPSLPVTPAPVRRPSFWSAERDDAGELPGAEGVPEQSEWDPVAKLVELQRRQRELLENQKGEMGEVGEGKKKIPERGVVESSKGVIISPPPPSLPPPPAATAAEGRSMGDDLPIVKGAEGGRSSRSGDLAASSASKDGAAPVSSREDAVGVGGKD